MKVYPPRDIRPFVMYCVNGKPRSSLLIESTDSMIYIYIYNCLRDSPCKRLIIDVVAKYRAHSSCDWNMLACFSPQTLNMVSARRMAAGLELLSKSLHQTAANKPEAALPLFLPSLCHMVEQFVVVYTWTLEHLLVKCTTQSF